MVMLLPPEYPPEQCASENCQCEVLKGKKAGEISRGEIYSRRNHKIAEYGNCCDLWGTQWAERHSVDSAILRSL
jgi:hypothetical protein